MCHIMPLNAKNIIHVHFCLENRIVNEVHSQYLMQYFQRIKKAKRVPLMPVMHVRHEFGS